MKIKALHSIPKQAVEMAGATDVLKQIPLGMVDGTPTMSWRVFTIEPGGNTPYHQHPYEHLNYIISGEGFLVSENGVENPLRTGDFVLVDPNERHQYRCSQADNPLVMICAVPRKFE